MHRVRSGRGLGQAAGSRVRLGEGEGLGRVGVQGVVQPVRLGEGEG